MAGVATQQHEQRAKVVAVCVRLRATYGNPRHGNKRNPLDELVYIILSTRTRPVTYQALFRALKQRFPSWDSLKPRNERELVRILSPGGLAGLKARQLVSIMLELRTRFGRPTLAPLRKMSTPEAQQLLVSLPGVGAKVAKCVLMYSLDRRVLPVDAHVHRVATRLGWATKKRPDTSDAMIEALVPLPWRYGFHVNAIAHGRAICLPRRPRCDRCPISSLCAFPSRSLRSASPKTRT